jgi:hypothetical protein
MALSGVLSATPGGDAVMPTSAWETGILISILLIVAGSDLLACGVARAIFGPIWQQPRVGVARRGRAIMRRIE